MSVQVTQEEELKTYYAEQEKLISSNYENKVLELERQRVQELEKLHDYVWTKMETSQLQEYLVTGIEVINRVHYQKIKASSPQEAIKLANQSDTWKQKDIPAKAMEKPVTQVETVVESNYVSY